MMNMINMVTTMMMNMVPVTDYMAYQVVRIVLFSVMVLCAIFLIFVVLLQPGNSSGVGALSGETETYLGKNKTKTKEGLLTKLTILASVLLVVFSISFFLVTTLVK